MARVTLLPCATGTASQSCAPRSGITSSLARPAARQTAVAARRLTHQPTTTSPARQLLCRASDEQQSKQQVPEAAQRQEQAAAGGQQAAAPQRPAVVDPSVAKGQRTAIITGAISIAFGVIYLALVSFLDMRGGELLPPPPEAFIP